MATLAPATPPISPRSHKTAGPAIFARFHKAISPSFHPILNQVTPAHTPPSSAGGAATSPTSISPRADRGMRSGITIFPTSDQSTPDKTIGEQRLFAATLESPTEKTSFRSPSNGSPQRRMRRPKSRMSIWPRKQHDPPPPVPELPHYLTIDLPFASAIGVQDAPLRDDRQNLYKASHIASTSAKLNQAASLGDAEHSSAMTPAAAVAQKFTQQYADEAQKLRESGLSRARALAEARLTSSQVVEILKLTGSEIKQRGLANVGILRPFRVGTSLADVSRLAELYLLSSEGKKYEGVLSLSPPVEHSGELGLKSPSSEIAIATLGRPSAHKDLIRQLAYANIHDVSEFLKWSLRRLKVNKADFGSPSGLRWYTDFVKREKEGGYKLTSFNDDLLAHLPTPTAELLTVLFDLLTTVSAHFVANAMPASRICKMLGYWVFGRLTSQNVHTDFESFVTTWKRSTGMMEHLLLAYLRNQSAQVQSMPTRLQELIRTYPDVLDDHFGAPLLSNGVGAIDAHSSGRALKVHLESSDLKPDLMRLRGPQELVHCALNARLSDGESSAEADDWTSLLRLARSSNTGHSRDKSEEDTVVGSDIEMNQNTIDSVGQFQPVKPSKLAALLVEEDLRIFEIYADEFATRRKMAGLSDEVQEQTGGSTSLGGTLSATHSRSSSLTPLSPITGSSTHFDMTASQSYPVSAFTPRKARLSILPEDKSASSRKSSGAKPVSSSTHQVALHSRQKSATSSFPSPQSEEMPAVDWTAFRQDGFDLTSSTDLSLGDAEMHRSLTIGDFRAHHAAVVSPSSSPATALRKLRGHTSVGNIRRRAQRRASTDYAHSAAGSASKESKRKASYTVSSVKTVELDEGLVSMWQDAVLDPSAVTSLPSVAFMALNKTASNSLMSAAGPVAGRRGKSAAASSTWLIIEETLVTGHATAPSAFATNGGRSARRGSGRDGDLSSLDGRRSLFAPSLRSMGASLFRRRGSLKKMSSFVALKRRASTMQHGHAHDRPNGGATDAPSATSEGYVLVPGNVKPSDGDSPDKSTTLGNARRVWDGEVRGTSTTNAASAIVTPGLGSSASPRMGGESVAHPASKSSSATTVLPQPSFPLLPPPAESPTSTSTEGAPSLRSPASVPARRSSMKRSKSSTASSAGTGTGAGVGSSGSGDASASASASTTAA